MMIGKTNKCKELIRLAIYFLHTEEECPGFYLYCMAHVIQEEVKLRGLDPRISDWAKEWKNVCERNWDELRNCRNPLTDAELRQWIRTKLNLNEHSRSFGNVPKHRSQMIDPRTIGIGIPIKPDNPDF